MIFLFFYRTVFLPDIAYCSNTERFQLNNYIKYVILFINFFSGYIGCFQDDNSRHLKHRYQNMGNAITLAKCRENCKGYKYAGLQVS